MSLPGESITEIPAAEEAVTEPVLDGAEGGNEYDETNLEGASDGTDGTETVETPDPYADFGGRDAIEKAIQLQKMTQSQDGVMRMMFAAAQSLGIPLSQVEQLFAADQGGASQEPQYADDDLITYGQVKEMLQRDVLQPWQQTEAQRAENTARQIVTTTRGELGIEDDGTWNAVLQLGDRYLGDDISPENVAKAIKQGHADFVNLVKTNAKAYVEKKAAVKQAVPKAPAGGSMPAAAPEAEPKTVEEAIARARKRLLGN